MPNQIVKGCINCAVCLPECPNQAISKGKGIFVIDPAKCTMCEENDGEMACVEVCPVDDVIIPL